MQPGDIMRMFVNPGGGGSSKLIMQADGNLVVYSSSGTALWDARTGGSNLAIYTDNAGCVWVGAAGSNPSMYIGYTDGGLNVPYPDPLSPGKILSCPPSFYGNTRVMLATNKQTQFCVRYMDNAVWWAPSGAALFFSFNSDGYFVYGTGVQSLYPYPTVTSISNTDTGSGSGKAMCIYPDGNLVIWGDWNSPSSDKGSVKWAVNDGGGPLGDYKLLMDSAGCTFIDRFSNATWATAYQRVVRPAGVNCVGNIPTSVKISPYQLFAPNSGGSRSDTPIKDGNAAAGTNWYFNFDSSGRVRWTAPGDLVKFNVPTSGSRVAMQDDGNLCVYDVNTPLWCTDTGPIPNALALLTDNAGCVWVGTEGSSASQYLGYTYGGLPFQYPSRLPGKVLYCPPSFFGSTMVMLATNNANEFCVRNSGNTVWWAPGGAALYYSFNAAGNFVYASGTQNLSPYDQIVTLVSTGTASTGKSMCIYPDGKLAITDTWSLTTQHAGTVKWSVDGGGANGNYRLVMDTAGCIYIDATTSATYKTAFRQVYRPLVGGALASCVGGV